MTEHRDKLQQLADELLSEVLEHYKHLVPPEAIEEIHAALSDLVLADPDGRALLRQMLPDPTTGASATIAREGPVKATDVAPGRKRASKK